MRPHVLPAPLCAALAAALATLSLAGCSGSSSTSTAPVAGGGAAPFAGAPLPGVRAPDFTLTDQDGRRVHLSQERGGVVVLAFLDSTCAPACVLVAEQIRGALDELTHPPTVLLVSVDPAADTLARVRRFLRTVSLSGRVRYLLSPPRALAAVWRAYRITTPSAGRASFEAAIPVLLIDPRGRERVLFEQEQLTPEALAHDIGALRAG